MTNQQILEKAIRKAVEGGWEVPNIDMQKVSESPAWYLVDEGYGIRDLIFNHDFAKALWARKHYKYIESHSSDGGYYKQPAWQYHLQQMVIAVDPIAYLGKNL